MATQILPRNFSRSKMQEPLPNTSIEKIIPDSGLAETLCEDPLQPDAKRQQTSTLIEFPRTTRPLPEWRKQLSKRVREVQERRAREAAEEAAAAQESGMVSCVLPSAQLTTLGAWDGQACRCDDQYQATVTLDYDQDDAPALCLCPNRSGHRDSPRWSR